MKPVSFTKKTGRPSGARRSHPEAGFSLVEAIVYMVVFTIMMGGLAYAMGTLFSEQGQPQVTYNQEAYTKAPSFDDLHQAIDLHTAFSNAVDLSDNIIVLGGTRSHPAFDATGPSSVLGSGFSDSVLSAEIGADPMQSYSSWDPRQANNSQFSASPYQTSNLDPADFTILTVQGLSRITSITQQRRYQATINGQNLALYEVTHQTIDWSSGSPVLVANATTGTTPTYFYRFYYPAGEDVWSTPPGATHYWYRTDPTWDRDQEGPSRVIFADPYALAGQDAASQFVPVSRFIYFLAQLR
jgi:hypothetical protein